MSNLSLLQELMSKSKKEGTWTDEAVEAVAVQFAKEAAESAYIESNVAAIINKKSFVFDYDEDEIDGFLDFNDFNDWWEEWLEQ